MLLEIAIGDAYGAGFEFVSRRQISDRNNLSCYHRHPHLPIGSGYYTDDTQMSLAVAEALLDERAWSRDLLAEYFVHAFKRDPREGYATSFFQFLYDVTDHKHFLREIRPKSDKSGAAMRACPLGVLPTITQVVEFSHIQAAITHDTPDGIDAATAVALASHYFIHRLGPKSRLGIFLEDHVDGDWTTPWSGEVGVNGLMCVRAAVTAVAKHGRMSELLKECVDFGGDVDTVAAIALGIASGCEEISSDLPQCLLNGLENQDFGRDYIIALDRRLSGRIAR